MTAIVPSRLSKEEMDEEIEFFRDICGWSDDRIEARLGLSHGTLTKRAIRARRKETRLTTSITDQVEDILLQGVLTRSGIDAWWDTKVPALYGHTPRELIAAGDSAAVLELAMSYLEESFT